ncbi:MAG: helix-turn-helix domain-containing protein [Cryobacterium sp.]|uniref:helix-turn-helix domain-containing protein n=1 Tax=unclassified Cryobacterium TaxID=2649013 RepID=UPI0018CAAAC2|nr:MULTISPECIES: helix-turn-helix domain-containing protein [unclassified Cryobacterium]MCY7405030.1 helix-turn-helix domain-containing protein [Cryobacterium sp.]MEC5153039.1 transcriptional regulator with XRE-family HTH domain [Cryobacterium sp. CAN_C3]
MTATILARAARAASGLSQSKLALLSGLASSSLSLIEHGKREPTVQTLETLLLATRHTVVTIPTVRSDAARIAAGISADLAAGSTAGSTVLGRVDRNGAHKKSADGHTEQHSAAANEAGAFRRWLQLADNLAAERGATRVGLTLTEPAPTGSVQWDTAIAALCEYRLNADALPVPEWVGARSGNPGAPWTPRTSDYDIPVDISQVPAEFLRRGILVEAATLESV